LRVLPGGKGKPAETPKPPPPPVPVRYATPEVDNYDKHWREMDAKLWRAQEKRPVLVMQYPADDDAWTPSDE
jgi:hypothetical protein